MTNKKIITLLTAMAAGVIFTCNFTESYAQEEDSAIPVPPNGIETDGIIPNGRDAGQPGHKIGVLAHRGYWSCEEAGYAENSIASLRCAQEYGFWGVEFDLHLTLDEVIIIVHDDVVDGKRIEDCPYSDFEDYRLKNGEKLPTWDDFLTQCVKNPKTALVCEFKAHSTPEREDRLMELAFAKLKEYGLYDPKRIMFTSFSIHVCKVIAETMPEFTVQYLGGDYNPGELLDDGLKSIGYQCRVLKDNPDWYGKAREKGMTVRAWGVYDQDDLEYAVNLGVDIVTSDYPLGAREYLKSVGIEEL